MPPWADRISVLKTGFLDGFVVMLVLAFRMICTGDHGRIPYAHRRSGPGEIAPYVYSVAVYLKYEFRILGCVTSAFYWKNFWKLWNYYDNFNPQ